MKLINFKHIKFFILVCLLTIATSCEVTDLSPANLVPEDEAYANLDRINGTVLGVYEAAQRGFYAGAVQRGYPFGAANVQQGDMRGEDMYNDQLFYEITYTNAHGINTANNNGQWISIYRLVNRINVVLKGLDGALENKILTEEEYNGFKGELLFLRALSYHELLVYFSRPYSDDPSTPGVPYRVDAVDDVSLVDEAITLGRTTVREDYELILADLDNAELLLSEGGAPFRVSKGAAIALKTRVKLHKQDWQGVIDEFLKIEDDFALTETPDGPFGSGTSEENIFSFIHSAQSNPGTNGALASMYGDPALNGRGLVKISPVIWTADFWVAGDLRRGDVRPLDSRDSTYADQYVAGAMVSSNPGSGIFTMKYSDFATTADPNPILRYAEVLLNTAEAYERLTQNSSNAVLLLNKVRNRSVPAMTPEITVGDDVLQAIFNERRIEFLAEGKRWFDIHRLSGEGIMDGIPEKAQSRSVNSIKFYTGESKITYDHDLDYEDNLFIWPIPQPEIINNPTLANQQNPGY
ncbi:hypothetical protein GCM10011506_28590 [Marivirga lumbricoides]|uniref:RagB/SusD family nutrient uptake outer membrane protein n=1 Tax=Marivirga lumbricoides TaxID=1046115 RepID=A0ABQ1MJ72_9BACT|nr:hypothetical protein GCM10011506_28590 [Marivirga lumbricoides]